MSYAFNADIYCDDCAEKIKEDIRAEGKEPENSSDERSFDSDDWPKWGNDDAEADCPQHCGSCGCFLENPLTPEGESYVKDAIVEHLRTGQGNREILDLWADYYDVSASDLLQRIDDRELDRMMQSMRAKPRI